MKNRKQIDCRFSSEQMDYMKAKAIHEAFRIQRREHDALMDAEAERLGIPTPYPILPEGHPLWIRAQELLTAEDAASELLHLRARALFDWASEKTLANVPCSLEQKRGVREMVAKVKQMCWVEKPFEELVDMSLKLVAR